MLKSQPLREVSHLNIAVEHVQICISKFMKEAHLQIVIYPIWIKKERVLPVSLFHSSYYVKKQLKAFLKLL